MGAIARKLVWVAGAVAVIVCLAGAYGAYMLAGYSWDQVVSYSSPFATYDRDEALPPPEPPSGETADGVPDRPPTYPGSEFVPSDTATRVVLVICDGLTLEAAREMTGLGTLGQYGSDMVATAPEPSLSYPTWTNILSGAPPDISGVTTNWFEGAVRVETLLDVALEDGRSVVVSAPEDFVTLYGADRATAAYFDEWSDEYMSARYVDQALEMTDVSSPDLVVIHLPDADEAAHDHGSDSPEYREVVQRIDGDLTRLVEGLQDPRTIFVICADHGHIPSGGHGGWEERVVRTPAIFAGPGVTLGSGVMSQSDIAPTVAALLGLDTPESAVGRVHAEVIVDSTAGVRAGEVRYKRFARDYLEKITAGSPVALPGGELAPADTYAEIGVVMAEVRAQRLAADRSERLPQALIVAGGALAALALLFAVSWRAGASAMAGVLGYYAVYNTLYFVLHRYGWSLSAFNTEEYVQAFFYWRMAEAALAALAGVGIAAAVYPLLRRRPRGPRQGFLGGWLALGPATVLAILATLALQVAWFLWAWGADVVWRLPDLKWGFKYDLDLTQATAVGAVSLLAPLVSYLVGRYHPRVRSNAAEE